MARLVAFGDAHLGRSHLAHLRDDQGRNVREEDFRRPFAWAIAGLLILGIAVFVWRRIRTIRIEEQARRAGRPKGTGGAPEELPTVPERVDEG